MKLMLLPVLILGLGCAPHAYHLGVSAGEFSFNRPVNDVDTHTVYAGVSWYPQQRAHEKRMETMAIAGLTNYGLSEGEIEALFAEQDEAASAEEEHVPFVPDVPETEEDRWNVLTYALMLLIIACAAWIFKAAGVSLPKRKPKGD